MTDRTYNALFPCTGNATRSQMAEALLNPMGTGRIRPASKVQPLALQLDHLARENHLRPIGQES